MHSLLLAVVNTFHKNMSGDAENKKFIHIPIKTVNTVNLYQITSTFIG